MIALISTVEAPEEAPIACAAAAATSAALAAPAAAVEVVDDVEWEEDMEGKEERLVCRTKILGRNERLRMSAIGVGRSACHCGEVSRQSSRD